MKNEGVTASSEAREIRLQQEYHEAVIRYQALKSAAPEAEELMFQDRPAANDDERIFAAHDLQIAALQGEAEAAAQKNERFAERAFRMLEQMKEAESKILGLYLDAKNESPELAELIRTEHPWVDALVHDAANDDTYFVDQQEAA